MIDFHSHFLPGIDDGAQDAEMSVAMLAESKKQGVDVMFATPHFYADEDDPARFLRRRARAIGRLQEAYRTLEAPPAVPELYFGAEVYYFPGISACEEMVPLALGSTGMLLVEPPMAPFTESMLREIAQIYDRLGLIPLMAHLDRYCRLLRDESLFDRVADHGIDIQVNAAFFLHRASERFALRMLEEEKFSVLGSDCHNLTSRVPNLSLAREKIISAGFQERLAKLDELSYNVLKSQR